MSMPVHSVFFTILMSGCNPSPTVPDAAPPPPIPQDATTVDGQALGPCDSFCLRARQLGCPEGEPTRADEHGVKHPCEEVCLNAADKGVDLAGPVTCTSSAKDCNRLRRCDE